MLQNEDKYVNVQHFEFLESIFENIWWEGISDLM